MRTLVIATKNLRKLRELKRYLKSIRADIVSLADFPKPPRIIENGNTFKQNAAKKALVASRFVNGLAIADDSGLCVNALKGAPGIRSSRFAGPAKSDKANNRKVLGLLKDTPLSKRQAAFVCAVAIADKGRILKLIEESCRGLIAFQPKGRHGFGYDPIFLIPRYGKTFGQLGLKVKDRMSHRSKALKKARVFLRKYLSGRSAAG
ncbi:MAG: RdgB/HAM1 family non-canonical purine NTP pyrophosphatase [Candidatus Omnitrophica bacterium]|nr:RdgB/HAM1 family non-canonical purine NTP pyrophosphatase [Candidatus Omnitrophota bacterium]MCM8791127.1 RdgB/HAM1 family non-canonical purine NTP pyrophosphatase [Candidatus Omnitrophota bacterium]